jgi:hypothetical protein
MKQPNLENLKVWIGMIIGIVIAIVLICVGIYLYTRDQSNLIDTNAKITTTHCNQIVEKNRSINYNCVLSVEYMVGNKKYTSVLNVDNGVPYNVGDTISISYDAKNPSISSQSSMRYATIGLILSAIGLVIIGGVSLKYYIAQRFKIAAAAEGTGSVLAIATAPFR